MDIYVFTTRTDHHYYFIKKILNTKKIKRIIYETESIRFNYNTKNPFSDRENNFEKKFFKISMKDKKKINQIPYIEISNINYLNLDFIDNKKDNLAIVFGCRKIHKKIFNKFNFGMLNIHRGLTQYYRGLDSEYWPIFFNEFDKLGTTIHKIDNNLDTGDIFYQNKLSLNKKNKIFHLKALTTQIAVDGIIKILDNFDLFKKNSKKQISIGKYYSAMRSSFKKKCFKILDNYLSK